MCYMDQDRRPKRKRDDVSEALDVSPKRLCSGQSSTNIVGEKRAFEDNGFVSTKRQTVREFPTERLVEASNRIKELERLVRVTKHIIAQQQLRLNELEYELKITRENVSCGQLNIRNNYVY